MTHILKFEGVNRRGIPSGGQTIEIPTTVAERLFNAGWRQLRITRDDVEVGGITRDPNFLSRRRTWWGDAA